MGTGKRHGLATMLQCMKHHESPICALIRIGHPPSWNPFRPSYHIDRFCRRVLRGIPNATFEDWNRIVCMIQSRDRSMRTSPSIRRAVIQEDEGRIVAWEKKGLFPIGEDGAKLMSHDPTEKLKEMMDSAIQETEPRYQQKRLKSGRFSKTQFECTPGVDFSPVLSCPGCGKLKPKHRLCFWFRWVGGVCMGCSNRYRAMERNINKADSELKELKSEVKQINKMVKELKRGTQ